MTMIFHKDRFFNTVKDCLRFYGFNYNQYKEFLKSQKINGRVTADITNQLVAKFLACKLGETKASTNRTQEGTTPTVNNPPFQDWKDL